MSAALRQNSGIIKANSYSGRCLCYFISMFSVAIVDDEKSIRNLIGLALGKEGFSVTEYPDGVAAWDGFRLKMPDVIVLDIIMPRMNGIDLCRKVREIDRSVPVIFLSSRDEEFDRILGLDAGADDYVCKPFSMMELLARIRAAVRRLNPGAEADCSSYDIQQGPLSLCSSELTVLWNGNPVKLSVTEFRILSSLAESPGTVKTREQLMAAAFPRDAYVNERAADSHIKRIRKKIKELEPEADIFEAVYGLGYKLGIAE